MGAWVASHEQSNSLLSSCDFSPDHNHRSWREFILRFPAGVHTLSQDWAVRIYLSLALRYDCALCRLLRLRHEPCPLWIPAIVFLFLLSSDARDFTGTPTFDAINCFGAALGGTILVTTYVVLGKRLLGFLKGSKEGLKKLGREDMQQTENVESASDDSRCVVRITFRRLLQNPHSTHWLEKLYPGMAALATKR